MPAYYVNNTPQKESGDHEVHVSGCYWLSIALDTTFLGYFPSCHRAVAQAKRIYPLTANGCAICSGDCHTS